MTLLITGGTGLIGKELGLELVKRGHKLIALSRNKRRAQLDAPYPATWIECDISKEAPDLSNYSLDGVFHLAGESVGEKTWSETQKEKILKSRTAGTENLCHSLETQKDLQFFIGASAMGYYGFTKDDQTVDEASPMGDGFLPEVTDAWEKASLPLDSISRRVLFRIGVVLSTQGGALLKMLFPAQIFASSPLSHGQQWLSWVHIQDVVRAFIFAMDQSSLKGTYNLVAPESSRQKEMAKLIAENLKAPFGPPIPGFMIRTLLGEQSSLALQSLRVSCQKLLNTGFQFQFKDLAPALKDILEGWQDGVAIKTYKQYFSGSREKVFEFFSSAENLEKITPPFLNFHITNMSTPKIENGTLLDYKLKIHGVPITWRTRIETWDPINCFTDTQAQGPYSLWHHTHLFEDLNGGTLMTDIIRYKVPMGKLGRLAAQALVDHDIDKIFSFRRDVMEKIF